MGYLGKSIAIVELNYHEEYLSTIAKLCGKNKVDVFTTPKIAERVRELYDTSDNINFIYNFALDEISEYDIIFFNTIRPSMLDMKYFRYFKKRKGTKVFLTIHSLL